MKDTIKKFNKFMHAIVLLFGAITVAVSLIATIYTLLYGGDVGLMITGMGIGLATAFAGILLTPFIIEHEH